MLSNESLMVFLACSLFIQSLYIRTLLKLNSSLFEICKVKTYYFYMYPASLIIYYIFIVSGAALYNVYLNTIFLIFIPLLSFLAFVSQTFFLLIESKKMLFLLGIKDKYFFNDVSGIAFYAFLIALLVGLYSTNIAIISLFIATGITHWIFINSNAKFLLRK